MVIYILKWNLIIPACSKLENWLAPNIHMSSVAYTGIDTALMGIGHEGVELVDTPPLSTGANECQQEGGARLCQFV